jgi:hypothetical protein
MPSVAVGSTAGIEKRGVPRRTVANIVGFIFSQARIAAPGIRLQHYRSGCAINDEIEAALALGWEWESESL